MARRFEKTKDETLKKCARNFAARKRAVRFAPHALLARIRIKCTNALHTLEELRSGDAAVLVDVEVGEQLRLPGARIFSASARSGSK